MITDDSKKTRGKKTERKNAIVKKQLRDDESPQRPS